MEEQIKIGQVTQAWAKQNSLSVEYSLELDSTNDLAKKEAFEKKALEESFILYVTENQTQGRGRGEHHWTSPRAGESLLSTWSFQIPYQPQPILVPLMGLALYRALLATWPYLSLSLKAPNDIFIGNKKCAGLLIETITQGDETRLLVGLGLNVISFPNSEPGATSLAHEMPEGAALLGEDYVQFLDRFLLEVTQVISKEDTELSLSDQQALKYALNKFPGLTEKIVNISAEGSIHYPNHIVAWTEL